ncbi:hypothetical protein [Pontibacter sp. G13]|nr:hypothetical protein [Pontibacter sp. G13]WNJ20074.1 hypothetical protein RJD25_06280 [Pontibacter sp. G13]
MSRLQRWGGCLGGYPPVSIQEYAYLMWIPYVGYSFKFTGKHN